MSDRRIPLTLGAIALAAFSLAGNVANAQMLSCDASPFGSAIVLNADREVFLGLVGLNVNGLGEAFRYADDGQSIPGTSNPGFSGLSEWESVVVDLNGDGRQETAYAGVNGAGNPVIAVVDEDANLIDTWTTPNSASNIQIAAVDYFGDDRQEELFIAFENGASSIFVLGFVGAANGGLQPADGTINFLFTPSYPDRDAFAMTSGDFLLEGREQVALVTVGESGGSRTVFFDLLFRNDQDQEESFRVQAPPSDVFSDAVVDVQAAAGHFDAAPGPQIAVAIQYETTSSSFPLELWLSDFSAQRDGNGQVTGITRTTFAQDSGGSSELPDIPGPGLYDLAVGDVLRDGTDELLLAFANESPEDNLSIWTYKYRPTTLTGDRFTTLARHSYPLSSAAFSPAAADLDDVSIAAADLDGDAYAEAVTAIAYGQDYDLRRWTFEAAVAENLGAGCDSNDTIGSGACPGTEVIPFPDELEDAGLPAQGESLADFRQQPADGIWELCVADSQNVDTGDLFSWTLRVNDEAPATSSDVAVAIPDGSNSPDACQTIDFAASSPNTDIETLAVDVAISHTWVGDLTIVLKSPLGSSLTLMNRPGRPADNPVSGSAANLVAGTPITFTDRAPSRAETLQFANPSSSGDLIAATVALPDADGDSPVALRSAQNAACRSVSEGLLQSVVFYPPVFSAIQDRNELAAQIGQARGQGQMQGTQVVTRSSNNMSGYVGAGLDLIAKAIPVKISAKYTTQRNYESATRQSESSASSQTVSEDVSVDGSDSPGGLVVQRRKSHDCYQYPIFRNDELIDDSFIRFCELIAVDERAGDVESWNVEIPTPDEGPEPAEWAPVVRGWSSLALGAITDSLGGGGTQPNAVDGLIPSGVPFSIDTAQQNAYFLVDLGEVRNIRSIRLHVPSDRRTDLADLRLYAYEFSRSPINVPSGPDVSEYSLSTAGGVLDIVNIATTTRQNDGTRTPKAARFILIRRPVPNGLAAFALDEIQVFGSDELTPDRHPVAVCDPAWGDGWFRAKTYVRGLVNEFVWTDIMGDLDWRSTLPDDPTGLDCVPGETNSPQVRQLDIWANRDLGASGDVTWNISEDDSQTLAFSSSISHSTRHAAEFDAEIGISKILSISGGLGIEFVSGISRAESENLFWSRSANMGARVGGILVADAVAECNYMPRPFSYRARTQSNTGYTHRPLVVDHIVETKPGSWTHAGGVPLDCLTSIPVELTVQSIGAAGVSIFAEPSAYSGTTDYLVDDLVPSSSIQLTAPASAGDTEFVQWTGCDSVDGTLGRICNVQVDADRTITAEYQSTDPVLIAHWPLDGNADDVSGNNHHGQLEGTTAFSTGPVGQALDLRGGQGWVDLPGNILDQLPSCSMSVWINLASNEPGDPNDPCCNAIYNEDGFTNGGFHNQFIPGDDPDTVGWVFEGLTGQQAKVNAPPLDIWRHYVMTYDASDASYRIYVNSLLEQEGVHDLFTPGVIPKCGSGLGATIGAWDADGTGNMTRFFDGQIDDVRLYTQELSEAEVFALTEEGQFTATVRSTGADNVPMGAVPASGAGTTDYTTPGFIIGTQPKFIAPLTSGNFEFTGWSGCEVVVGASNEECIITLLAFPTVTANYERIGFDLSVRSTGAQGVAISASPVAAGGTTDYTVPALEEGTGVFLTAPETSGGLGFTGWIGCDLNSGNLLTSCEVVMDEDRSVMATYDDVSDEIFRGGFEGNLALPPG